MATAQAGAAKDSKNLAAMQLLDESADERRFAWAQISLPMAVGADLITKFVEQLPSLAWIGI